MAVQRDEKQGRNVRELAGKNIFVTNILQFLKRGALGILVQSVTYERLLFVFCTEWMKASHNRRTFTNLDYVYTTPDRSENGAK